MGVKISELPAASALAGTEPLPLVQATETRKATVADIAPVRSVAGKTGAVTLAASDVGAATAVHSHVATEITNTPAGTIAATNVQAAIDELDSEKLAATSYTASDILTKLQTVDGASSGLDADLLDGNHASAFATSGHNHSGVYEPVIGNPASDGQVLSSMVAGVRSWVTVSATATPNLIATAYSVPADTSTMIVGTLEITATGALDNNGNVGVW